MHPMLHIEYVCVCVRNQLTVLELTANHKQIQHCGVEASNLGEENRQSLWPGAQSYLCSCLLESSCTLVYKACIILQTVLTPANTAPPCHILTCPLCHRFHLAEAWVS